MGPQKAAALRAMILSQAQDNFQYLYQHFNFGGDQISGEIDGLFLSDLMDYLRGTGFQEFARRLTGVEELNDIYAHATLYTAGNFLKVHEDVTTDDDRRFTYVFGFTRNCRADTGGLLHLLAAADKGCPAPIRGALSCCLPFAYRHPDDLHYPLI